MRPERSAATASRGLLLLVSMCLLGGCAAQQASIRFPVPPSAPDRVRIDGVPLVVQDDYQCGPAALAMALGASGVDVELAQLVAEVYTPSRKGSLQFAMVAATRRQGRIAYTISGARTMLAELAAGHPVVILENLGLSWMPRWHYAVVVGYDAGPEPAVILHSGGARPQRVPWRTFDAAWSASKRWGLLVLAPDVVPATASEERFITAALGLERARQWEAATTAYHAALARWPMSLIARIGLGNAAMASGDTTAAEAAYREAASLHPESGAAFNNLARALATQGRWDEAQAAARKAVAIGGPLEDVYRETLEQIDSAQQRAGAPAP